MNNRRRLCCAAVAGCIATSTWFVSPALAAVGTASPTEPTAPATTIAGGNPTSLIGGEAYHATIWVLVFGIVATLLILAFLSVDRARTAHTLLRLSKLRPTSTTDTPAQTRVADTGWQVEGPRQVTIGSSAAYTLKTTTNEDPKSATWSASGGITIPQDAAGAGIVATAVARGAATLTATVGTTIVPIDLMIVESTSSTVLSILGEGWGSVITAIAILSVTAALGFAGTLNGQAVAGILGSLVTYAIVRRTNNN